MILSTTFQSIRRGQVALLALGVALAIPMMAFSADTKAPDSQQARESAAKEYLKVQPVEQLYQDTINELSTQVPEEKRPEFLQTMSTAVDLNKLNQLALTSLTKNFTAEELAYMTQFYGSPTGKAIYSKFPNYLSDIGQGLRDVITLPDQQATTETNTAKSEPATTKSQTAVKEAKPKSSAKK